MVVRNNQVEQIWQVQYDENGFKYYIYIRGTADEMYDYLNSEMGFVGQHHALSDKEKDALWILKAKVYIAPEIRH